MARTLWIGTRKGAFPLTANDHRDHWTLGDPHFFGHVIQHIVQDPRDPDTLLMAARTGHLGPTVFRSSDRGKTWREALQPPAFRKAAEGEEARAVERTFWLTPGHASQPGSWYVGTSPAGLFKSDDAGDHWQPVAGFNDHPMRKQWVTFPTPDGEFLHSILVDPRDAQHLYLGISIGGVFESTDGGASWAPLNEGVAMDYMPESTAEFGHDPHCVVIHPTSPDRLYQQNHCGLYRIDRPSRRWERIGNAMPREIGDIGFSVVTQPDDPNTAWVFPMDGTEVWPRTCVGGKPAAYVTHNAGETWQRQDRGLPPSQAWFTVLRQAMCVDTGSPTGVYFGTTSGEVWASKDGGESWRCIAQHLPEIHSVNAAV